MKRIKCRKLKYRFLSILLAAVLTASSCYTTQINVLAEDGETTEAPQDMAAPAEAEAPAPAESEAPAETPADVQEPAAEAQDSAESSDAAEIIDPAAETAGTEETEITGEGEEAETQEGEEDAEKEESEDGEKEDEEQEKKEETAAETEYEEIILSEDMPEIEIPRVRFTLNFVDQNGQPITEGSTTDEREDESAASGNPITQTIELSESRTEYFFNKESVDAPEGYDFTAAEAGGEEVTRLYVTYETITVEKTIHKVRRAVSHAEPGNGDAADETAGGSEASDAAEASLGESAAQEEEFTETVEVEVKVPSFGYETADGAKHEVKEDTAVTVRCEQTEVIEEKEEQKIPVLHYSIVDEDGTTIGEYSGLDLPDFDGTVSFDQFPQGESVSAATRIGNTNRYYEVEYHFDHAAINSAPAEWLKKEQTASGENADGQQDDQAAVEENGKSEQASKGPAYFYGTGDEKHALTEDAEIVLTYKAQEQSRSFYLYRDDEIEVTVRLSSGDAVPDQAELVVTPIPQGPMQDAYLDALNQNAAQNGNEAETADSGEAYDASNTLLYDIAFMIENPDGGKVEFEPKEGDVNVKFRFLQTQLSDLADEPEQIEVSHLTLSEQVKSQVDATIQAENITADDIHVEQINQDDTTLLDANQIRFETESFSVFGFRVDGQLRKRVISASGATYEIIVTYGADAKIPEDAELEVTEILEEDEEYEETVNRTLEALRENADPDTEVTPSAGKIRIFDISIMSAGKEVQPAAAVDVSAELVGMKADESVSVVHFTEDGDDVITPDDKGSDAICFTTESFSRYVFVDQDGETGDPVTDLAGQSYALTVLVKNKYSTIQSENNPKFSNRRAALQVEVVTVDGKQMIFSDGSETKWTFEPVDPENGVYYVSTMVDGSKKYLTISSTKEGPIILSDTAGEAQEITVTVQDGGRVRLDHGGMAPNLQGDNIANGFRANNYFGDSEKIYLTKATDAFATAYMASVSDLDGIYKVYGQEGSAGDPDKIDQIVLYQSVVNETTGETELYALDGNGELVRVTESGDQIYMAASPDNNWTTPELYWQLVIYVDDLESKNPTGYYQLYNPATGKYLTPSMNGVVSSEVYRNA